MALSFKPIRPLLQTGTNKSSRLFSYAGLGIGVLLLLCAIQMYINIQSLLREGSIRKNGFDYISITKNVTAETQGQEEKNLFRQTDIDELKKQPFIDGVEPLLANDFHVKLSAGAMIPFRTDMFLEALDNSYIDTVPPSFAWQPGQRSVPIILSSDFLEIYNVFAPGQGLPQISRETATSLAVNIHCEGREKEEIFVGRIAAFSDRINSVLVPKSFLDWANQEFGKGREVSATRLFIKTKDANNPDFLRFLDGKDYKLNKDKTILGRNKMVIDGIFSGLGIFGLLVVILALMLFSFYLQLVIARSRDSLQLLLTIGYSPAWLSRNFSKRFIPVYITIVLTALLVTQLAQWAFHHFVMFDRPELSSFIHWGVWLVGVVLIILSIVTNYRLVRKLLYRLY
ncbi:ABC transporter permease [Terrimonas ferruginea]|uniref:ABC transporter permease n=1 Tax=Terrimonas ferruginea TaxID=249 RepID=UPI000400E532|nr:ABC transporter permease [Terrimonas ferruginea]